MGVLEFILWILGMILVAGLGFGIICLIGVIINNTNIDEENKRLKEIISKYEYKNNDLGGKE